MSETTLDRMLAILESNDIKPKQITRELGISNSSFTDWGKGKDSPSVKILSKFAERFDVSLDYLVFGEERGKRVLDFSNPLDKELLDKFHKLDKEYQLKLLGYIDGLMEAMSSESSKKGETAKLSV